MKNFLIILLLTGIFLSFIPARDTAPKYTVIEKNNKKGLLDLNGKMIIPPSYDDLGWSSGKATVYHERIGYKENGKWGILNLKNEKLTSSTFLSLIPAGNEVCIAGIPDQYNLSYVLGLVDYDGKSISGFIYNFLQMADDYFIAGTRKYTEVKYGVINSKGKITIPVNYKNCSCIGHNLFALSDNSDNILIYNGNGNLITKYAIDSIGSFVHGYATIKRYGKLGVIDASGKVVLPPENKRIKIDDNGRLTYLPFNEWRLIDNNNDSLRIHCDSIIVLRQNKLISFANKALNFIDSSYNISRSYNNLHREQFINNEIIAKERSKYGLIDSTGMQLYPFIYDSIISYPGYVLLKKKEGADAGWIIGNHWGEIINYGPFEKFFPASKAYLLTRRKGYWGIVYGDGTEKINCIYDSIQDYVNGLLKVNFHNESGLLWKNNWLVYPGKYQIDLLPDQRIIVSDYRGSTVINILGDTIYHSDDIVKPFADFYLDRDSSNFYGLLDSHFKRILYPVCYHIDALSGDSIFIYRNPNGWGALNKKGRILFSNIADLDTIISYSEGFFKVIIDHDYGFIDNDGKLRIANRYEDAGDFLNGIVSVKLLGQWGFVNKAEQLIIQPFYDRVENHSNKLIIVAKGNKYGVIDQSGKTVLEMDYDDITPVGNIGFLCKKDGLYGFMNNSGNLSIIPRFDKLELVQNGTFIAIRNNKYGLVSDSGETLIPVIYDNLKYNRALHQLWGCIAAEWHTL